MTVFVIHNIMKGMHSYRSCPISSMLTDVYYKPIVLFIKEILKYILLYSFVSLIVDEFKSGRNNKSISVKWSSGDVNLDAFK